LAKLGDRASSAFNSSSTEKSGNDPFFSTSKVALRHAELVIELRAGGRLLGSSLLGEARAVLGEVQSIRNNKRSSGLDQITLKLELKRDGQPTGTALAYFQMAHSTAEDAMEHARLEKAEKRHKKAQRKAQKDSVAKKAAEEAAAARRTENDDTPEKKKNPGVLSYIFGGRGKDGRKDKDSNQKTGKGGKKHHHHHHHYNEEDHIRRLVNTEKLKLVRLRAMGLMRSAELRNQKKHFDVVRIFLSFSSSSYFHDLHVPTCSRLPPATTICLFACPLPTNCKILPPPPSLNLLCWSRLHDSV
jgi:hypothetical protein